MELDWSLPTSKCEVARNAEALRAMPRSTGAIGLFEDVVCPEMIAYLAANFRAVKALYLCFGRKGPGRREMEAIASLPALSTLWLQNARFEDGAFEYLGRVTNLSQLSLVGSDRAEGEMRHLAGLERFRELAVLGDAGLAEADAAHLSALKGIDHLATAGCATGLRALGLLKNVRRLTLIFHHGELEGCIAGASGLGGYEEVELFTTAITPYEPVAAFGRALPEGVRLTFRGRPVREVGMGELTAGLQALGQDMAGLEGFATGLPAMHHWAGGLIDAAPGLGPDVARAASALVRHESFDREWEAVARVLVALLPVLAEDEDRADVYLWLHGIDSCEARPGLCGDVARALLRETPGFISALLDRCGLVQSYGGLLGWFVREAAEGKLGLGFMARLGMKARAKKAWAGAAFCSACGAHLGPDAREGDRCDACWGKSFDDWNERYEASDTDH